MKRYVVKMAAEGKQKYYYIQDSETFDIVLYPTKYLKHKTDANRSPNTVRRIASSLCYYMKFLLKKEIDLMQVGNMSFEEQYSHFVQFLYWLKEGRHITDNRIGNRNKGTCNAYLKDVFGFFLYMADCCYTEPLKIMSYNQITVANATGVNRTIRSNSFRGYFKAEERNVRSAEEDEIVKLLRSCTNNRDRLLILLLAETGFRIGEVLGIDYTRDINYERHTISVYFRDDNENNACT